MRAWLARRGLGFPRESAAYPDSDPPGSGERPYPGWFIALEGGDGVGKSTQVRALAAWLNGRGFEIVTTREPGATELGLKLREILLHATDHGPTGARTEALLFAADRAHHVEKVVRPALRSGAIVITDRYVDSSIAYQSGGRGLSQSQVAALSEFATDGLMPDLTVLLDIDPEVAWRRLHEAKGGLDKLEAEPPAFHHAVREVFKARAAADPEHYLVVDASEPPGVITGIIEDRLDALLPHSPQEAAEHEKRHRALIAAREEETRQRHTRFAAEREQAEQEARRLEDERAAAQRERDEHSARAVAAQAERAVRERETAELLKVERERRAAADENARQLREAEQKAQAELDAKHRLEAEMVVRQIEARAKATAREQAATYLNERAQSEERTRRMVEESRRRLAAERAALPPDDAGSDPGTPELATTKSLVRSLAPSPAPPATTPSEKASPPSSAVAPAAADPAAAAVPRTESTRAEPARAEPARAESVRTESAMTPHGRTIDLGKATGAKPPVPSRSLADDLLDGPSGDAEADDGDDSDDERGDSDHHLDRADSAGGRAPSILRRRRVRGRS